MTQAAEKILSDATKLSAAERAEIAEKLLETLEPFGEELSESEHAASWSVEIARRLEELDSGKVKTILWEQVKKMIGASRLNGA